MKNINATTVLKKAKGKLGIRYFKLPIPDEDLVEVIMEDTLSTFSNHFPRYIELPMDLNPVSVKDKNLFQIDTSMFGDDMYIVTVEDVKTYSPNFNEGLTFGSLGGYDYDGFGELSEDISVKLYDNVPFTFEFETPDKVRIHNQFGGQLRGKVIIELGVSHSLNTIPASYYDEFLKLVILDLKQFIYENLKRLDKLDTTFGQIDLKIDDWSSAESDRETLLEKWSDKYVMHRKNMIYLV